MPIYKYKNKSGTFYYVKVSIKGKQYIKRGFKDKNQALVYEASICNDPGVIKTTNYLCKDLASLFKEQVNNSVKATTAYSKLLIFKKYVLSYFSNFKVSDISTITLEFYAKHINASNGFKNKNKIFCVAKEFLNFLKDYGLHNLSYNALKMPYKSNYQNKTNYNYYTQEEFNQFISAVDSPKYKLLFDLLFYYGLRISECLGLRFKDFTKDRVFICGAVTSKTATKGQVHITTKTASSMRDYPLINIIKDDFITYLNTFENGVMKNDFVFKSSNKKTLTIGENPVREAQKKYEKLSGVKHIKLHEFRHSCATILINNGFSPEQVASWLGHSSSNVTLKTYFHLFPSKKNAIGDYFNDNNCIKS